MSQIKPDTIKNDRKRKFSPTSESKDRSSLTGNENYGKRNKVGATFRPMFTIHNLTVDEQNDDGRLIRSLIEKIISEMPENKTARIVEFHPAKPILMTIPMMVRVGEHVSRKRWFL